MPFGSADSAPVTLPLVNAILRAVDHYADLDNWKKLMIHDMREDFSWNVSAREYRRVYESLVQPEET